MKQVVFETDGRIVAVHHDRESEPPMMDGRDVLSVPESNWPEDFSTDSYSVEDGGLVSTS